MRYTVSFIAFTFCLSFLSGQDIVDINLDVKHSVEGVSELDRSRFFLIHASSTDGEWPNETIRQTFHEDYDVYLGRNNGSMPWYLSQCKEDPLKPGWPSVEHLQQMGTQAKNNYANASKHHKYENRMTAYMMGGQEGMYPNGEHEFGPNNAKWKMAKGDYSALAEYYANFLKYFHGTGGTSGAPKPAYFEVMNEPFVKATNLGTTRANLSTMHKFVAKRVKELNPEVKVGGYSAAHPAYEASDFKHWENNWKTFIDIAGDEMDYFSLHLYDNIKGTPGTGQYRAGSNIEAILDMVEHYSYLKLGVVKPFCISEMGCLITSEGTPYTRERDWHNLRSFSTITMQLLEKQNLIDQSLPFLLVKGSWWKDPNDPSIKYGFRLFRQKKELAGETGEEWVYTDLVKFYQLWSNVKGTRIDTKASNPDMQVDSYVDGNKAYVILNNMHHETRWVNLVMNGFGDAKLQSVLSKHVYAAENNWIPTLDEETLTKAPAKVKIGREATMILEYTFDRDINTSETSLEKKYYADTYFKTITANESISFNINDVTLSDNGEAMLRLGLGRDHGKSLQPQLIFNDSLIEVPSNFRGNEQQGRDRFFGVIEIPVPYDLLKDKNHISLSFPDNGGHVSSLSIQVFNFSKAIPRTGDQIIHVRLNEAIRQMKPGKQFQMQALVWPTNFVDKSISWRSSNSEIVTVSENGLITAKKEGTANIIVTTHVDSLRDTCQIIVSESAPLILAESIEISPRSLSVVMNSSQSLTASFLPLDVDNTLPIWTSADTSLATVSSMGDVLGKKLGKTYIIATTSDGSNIKDSILLNITPLPNSVDCSLIPEAIMADSILSFEVIYTLGDTMDIAVEIIKNGRILPWVADMQKTSLPGEGKQQIEVIIKDKESGKAVIPQKGQYILYARIREVGGDYKTNSRKCLKPIELLEYKPNNIKTLSSTELKIFPNPANATIELVGVNPSFETIHVYTILGHECAQFDINAKQQYNINFLPKGTYLLKLSGPNGVLSKLFVKN